MEALWMNASMNGLLGRFPDEPGEKLGEELKLLELLCGDTTGPSRKEANDEAKD